MQISHLPTILLTLLLHPTLTPALPQDRNTDTNVPVLATGNAKPPFAGPFNTTTTTTLWVSAPTNRIRVARGAAFGSGAVVKQRGGLSTTTQFGDDGGPLGFTTILTNGVLTTVPITVPLGAGTSTSVEPTTT